MGELAFLFVYVSGGILDGSGHGYPNFRTGKLVRGLRNGARLFRRDLDSSKYHSRTVQRRELRLPVPDEDVVERRPATLNLNASRLQCRPARLRGFREREFTEVLSSGDISIVGLH